MAFYDPPIPADTIRADVRGMTPPDGCHPERMVSPAHTILPHRKNDSPNVPVPVRPFRTDGGCRRTSSVATYRRTGTGSHARLPLLPSRPGLGQSEVDRRSAVSRSSSPIILG